MSFSIGIVGLPNVGKSTLFNLLTNSHVAAENFPFCTIDPNVGCVKVPDDRVPVLAQMSKSKKVIPTTVEFVDIAGIIKGAHQGEGLGNQFLSHIREVDAICHVVRVFQDKNVIHVSNKVDPDTDREIINMELIMADLQVIDKKLENLRKIARGGTSKELTSQMEITERIKKAMEDGKLAKTVEVPEELKKFVKQFNLLTSKPFIYALNVDEATADYQGLKDVPAEHIIRINAKIEAELEDLSAEEQKEYMEALGIKERGLEKLIKTAYKILGLITFLTTGEDETRAWTIPAGTKAPQAAGVIHSDFEKAFIRAEVISYGDFVKHGGEAGARDNGALRIEGKDYVVKDGDICNFRVGV